MFMFMRIGFDVIRFGSMSMIRFEFCVEDDKILNVLVCRETFVESFKIITGVVSN